METNIKKQNRRKQKIVSSEICEDKAFGLTKAENFKCSPLEILETTLQLNQLILIFSKNIALELSKIRKERSANDAIYKDI